MHNTIMFWALSTSILLVGCAPPPQRVSPAQRAIDATRGTANGTLATVGSGVTGTVSNGSNGTSSSGTNSSTGWAYSSDKLQGTDHFNLAEHIKGSPEAQELHQYVGDSGLGMGDRSKIRVETNLTADLLADSNANETGVIAKFKVDYYLLNQQFGTGLLVDYYAYAHPEDRSRLEAHMRFWGYDKVVSDGNIDEHYTREVAVAKLPISPLPPVQIFLMLKTGGTLGLKTEMGVQRNQQFQVLFQPEVDLLVGIDGVVRLVVLVDAKADGDVKLIKMRPSLSANLGLKKSSYTYANLVESNGDITGIDGKIDLVVNLSYKGILPFGLDAIAFNKAVRALGYGYIADGKEWRWTVFDPEAVRSNVIPGYSKPIFSLSSLPNSAANCKTTSDSLASFMRGHIEDLNSYSGRLSDDARNVTEDSSKLMNDTIANFAADCNK